MLTVFVVIRNTDDHLTQGRWAMLHLDVAKMLQDAGATFHGEWHSAGAAMWQNACWCVDVPGPAVEQLKAMLAGVARAYDEMVVWSPATQHEVLG